MGTYIVDVCPNCRKSPQHPRSLLPITARRICCYHCQQTVLATRDAVVRSWQTCFYVSGFFVIWFVLILGAPFFTGNLPPLGKMAMMLFVGWFFAGLLASPLLLVGWIVGYVSASRLGL